MKRRDVLAAGPLTVLSTAVRAAPSAVPPDPSAARDRAIWNSTILGKQVWGYSDRHSVAPGQTARLMLSTGAEHDRLSGTLEIYRIGAYAGGDRRLMWQSQQLEIRRQIVEPSSPVVGAAWPVTVEVPIGADWPSGYYTVDVVIDGGVRDRNAAHIIVATPQRAVDLRVILCTNTWNAYNAWGGCSLYESAFTGDRAQIVSFDRPSPVTFFDAEYYLVGWLEALARRHGLSLDYVSNFDLHAHPQAAQDCGLLISGPHNEYWSAEEFDNVHRRIFQAGRPVLFLGANAAYWQIRYADIDAPPGGAPLGRQLVCYKSPDDPIRRRLPGPQSEPLVTVRFRDGGRRPETMLAGAAYQSWFPPARETDSRFPYIVARTDLPIFQGTGYVQGEAIGDLVGYEWDNTDPMGDGKRLWNAEHSYLPLLDPARIQVLFEGHPIDAKNQPGKAEAVYFVSPAGAKVFCASSIRWAWGFGKPGFASEKFRAFNRNLVLDCLGRDFARPD